MALGNFLSRYPALAGYEAGRQMVIGDQQRELGNAQTMLTLASLLQQQQQRQQAMQRQAEYRAALATAGEDPEKQVAVARRYGEPDDVMKYAQGSLDRKAQREQRAWEFQQGIQAKKEAAEQALASKIELAKQAGADRQSLMQMQLEGRRDIAQMMAAVQRESIAARRDALQQGNKPPSGYRYTPEGNLEAIPGGPADLKIQGQFNQDTASLQSTTSALDRLASETNRLLKHPGLSKATGLMSIVPGVGGTLTIPGTDAANFKAGLDTLKSQVGFGVLQEMRNNSKTGGALGQISDRENTILQANLAALDRAQSSEEYEAALGRILKYVEDSKDRLRNAYNMKHKGQQQPQPSGAADVPQGVDPKVWAVMTPEEKALWKK